MRYAANNHKSDLKSAGRKAVGVQFPLRAPVKNMNKWSLYAYTLGDFKGEVIGLFSWEE